MGEYHESVLLNESVFYLKVRPGKKYIDATVGTGGHTAAILRRGGSVLGIDCNPEAIAIAQRGLEVGSGKCAGGVGSWRLVGGNFRDIKKIAKDHGFYPVAGVLFDLGLSSYQLEHSGRGFSFLKDEPLDMRTAPDLTVKAADLVNGLSRKELYELFKNFGEDTRARRLADAIVKQRRVAPIKTTKQLADLVYAQTPLPSRVWRNPATKIFQALRIAVNSELSNLQSALPQALDLLEPKGRLVVISFHSLEDRIVKRFFREGEVLRRFRVLTRRPRRPSVKEVRQNPRSRSAKLRAVELVSLAS